MLQLVVAGMKVIGGFAAAVLSCTNIQDVSVEYVMYRSLACQAAR